jgi:hypothetical protein
MPAATPGVVENACATCGSNGSQTLMFTELAKAAVEKRKIVRAGTFMAVDMDGSFTSAPRWSWEAGNGRRAVA